MTKNYINKRFCFTLLLLFIFTTLINTASVACNWDILPGFKDPPVDVRLKNRGGGNPAALQELAETGFGAAETGVNWDDPEQLSTLLQAAEEYGITIDLSPGGGMPYSTPGITEEDSQFQLTPVPSALLVSDGTLVYNDLAPRLPDEVLAPSPTLALVAVTAARVTGTQDTTTLLDPDSAVDLTSLVDESGVLNWTVPEGEWVVFGFWERATGQITGGYPPFESPAVWSSRVPTQNPGMYFIADIFSEVGIGNALDHLADTFFTPENLEFLKGTQFAHDSLEVQCEMLWTRDLPQEFESRRGYSMIKYLPALHTPKEGSFDPLTPYWHVTPPITPEYDFINDVGRRVRYDYRRTLADLYVDHYLKTFTDKLNEWGMSSRVEVAYNYLPLNMTRSGIAVDIPENESFDAGWAIPFDPTMPTYETDRWRFVMDSYRLTGSGAHLGGADRATIEFGDDFAQLRKQPVDYARQLNEAYAGGITMGLLTGFAGVDDSWPTPKGLYVLGIGDIWTTGWPQWRDWSNLADYFSRSTLVLETEKPQIDVVIYLDEGLSSVRELNTPKFASSTLETAGFTYDFVDPVTLISPKALVGWKKLFGGIHGPGYKALVLNNESSIPASAARRILLAARKGVAVVVVGDAPSTSTGLYRANRKDKIVARAMERLLDFPNVAQVSSEDDVADALLSLGIEPAACFGNASPLLTVHRVSLFKDLWWVFNPTDQDISAMGSFEANGVPYQLDLWNGTYSRVAQWEKINGRVLVPITLPANATTALVFKPEWERLHVVSTTAEEALYQDDALVVRDTQGGIQTVALSDGRTLTVDLGTVPAPMEITAWHLDVDEISPAGHTFHSIDLTELADWRDIPELQDAVGSALYSATVNLPAEWLSAESDVMLEIGAMEGAMQLSVNGMPVTNQTTPGGRWSVKDLLIPGDNSITVRLDTSLLNRYAQLANSHVPGYFTIVSLFPEASGLLGPVQLIPAAIQEIEIGRRKLLFKNNF